MARRFELIDQPLLRIRTWAPTSIWQIHTLVLTVELLPRWVCPGSLHFQRRHVLLPRRYPIIASGRLNHNVWRSVAKLNTTIPRTRGLAPTITKPLVCVIQRHMGWREVFARMVEAEQDDEDNHRDGVEDVGSPFMCREVVVAVIDGELKDTVEGAKLVSLAISIPVRQKNRWLCHDLR